MNIKRIGAAVVLLCVFLGACSGNGQGSAKKMNTADAGSGQIRIVTTIFPEYDWVMQILGDNPANANVTMLLDQGVDLHSYQPTMEDIVRVSGCDLFIYVGGESDVWVEDALKEAINPNLRTINLLEVLGSDAREEEEVEGMQCEEDAHEETDGHDHDGEETEYDEHVWLSLRSASKFCTAIEEAIASIDPDHANTYQQNLTTYLDQLQALDMQYSETVDASASKTLLFGDRFPFRYLTDDYGLTYYAAFSGCSAETEASFETILFLAGKVDELSLPAVLIIDGSDGKIAQTIIENTKAHDAKILTLDSMQSVSGKDVEAGTRYLSIMEENLSVLREALNK